MDKIVCLGKNYAEHAKELGEKIPEKPVIFLKPFSVLRSCELDRHIVIDFPKFDGQIHHELEIVLRIRRDVSSRDEIISAESKLSDIIETVTLGLDMTKRDLQANLKKNGHPWTIAKVFVNSAIVGPWINLSKFNPFDTWKELPFTLHINGILKQQGNLSQMLLSPFECIQHVLEFFPLRKGDLIFTGTPAGVGEVKKGDRGKLQWGDLAYEVQW